MALPEAGNSGSTNQPCREPPSGNGKDNKSTFLSDLACGLSHRERILKIGALRCVLPMHLINNSARAQGFRIVPFVLRNSGRPGALGDLSPHIAGQNIRAEEQGCGKGSGRITKVVKWQFSPKRSGRQRRSIEVVSAKDGAGTPSSTLPTVETGSGKAHKPERATRIVSPAVILRSLVLDGQTASRDVEATGRRFGFNIAVPTLVGSFCGPANDPLGRHQGSSKRQMIRLLCFSPGRTYEHGILWRFHSLIAKHSKSFSLLDCISVGLEKRHNFCRLLM
jgi:hypothetical protein